MPGSLSGVMRQVVRMLTAKLSVSAPGWNRYRGQRSIVPPARSARQGAWATMVGPLGVSDGFRMRMRNYMTRKPIAKCCLLKSQRLRIQIQRTLNRSALSLNLLLEKGDGVNELFGTRWAAK